MTVSGFLPRISLRGLLANVLLPLALAGMLVYELSREETLSQLNRILTYSCPWRSAYTLSQVNLQAENPLWLLAAVVLMPLNWWTEMQKWHRFVRRFEPMSPARAWRAVLAGVAVSLFTPNRVGEYGGRILFVRPEHRWLAASANLAGNIAQAAVLVSGGALGGIWLTERLQLIGGSATKGLAALAMAGTATVWLMYFHLP